MPGADMAEKLGLRTAQKGLLFKYRWPVVVLILITIVAIFSFRPEGGARDYSFRTAPAMRGDLTATVTATGSIQPLNQVDVGAEISGLIEDVHVDFNDRVSQGQDPQLRFVYLSASFDRLGVGLKLS